MSQERKNSASFISILSDRAKVLRSLREFFYQRAVIEVDCPSLAKYASIDPHIDLLETKLCGNETYYFASSPEYRMKELLSLGMQDIYQLSHVFRDGEKGDRHFFEFMMLEWYRIGFSFEKMIQETIELISLFIGNRSKQVFSYREAFIKYIDKDPMRCSKDDLMQVVKKNHLDIGYTSLLELDDLIIYLFAELVEPLFDKDFITVITHYPYSQRALAKVAHVDGVDVGLRFECYYKGYELANGYEELTDSIELKKRLKEYNQKRASLGKKVYPLDENCIEAHKKGFPCCSGVAVGFDRLMMIRNNKKRMEEVFYI